ncbi:SsgA family sporulation/cell division regulator [Streptomyces sp. CB03238]|uniref:SsgA family sporulation/cell division regulator n=1 Tax=Streptomyces sp. CB03238 TaxID=1907777 RepID=UPI000A100900|nr:SsgA family sporulation/cell division regulator [Streptomyces sp. CB03238]ORT58546.1 adenylate cyclase [Streptomyces sp. CB03238]
MEPLEEGVVVHTKALIVTDGPLSRPVPVAMRYEPAPGPAAEPATVRLCFPGGTEWSFPRTLLESGLRAPARGGDIGIWPCGRVQTIVEYHAPEGVAVVQFDSSALLRFLRRTYAATTSTVTR